METKLMMLAEEYGPVHETTRCLEPATCECL
ncbi:hypothetical protein PVAP13_8NG317284 [Panicum virgatum]|uniref:Uncharacterized protein n=1 Tax=Panicum virgatum TaxID=38727 RepID=A0A8T0PJ18_PANVG|nr:hypothetical protein PVAP13_8NG317284 [Panicum virgatum]